MKRVLLVVSGVCVGVVAGLVLPALISPGGTPLPRAHLASDIDGALKEIHIQYKTSFHDASIDVLASFLAALPKDVVVRAVVESEEEFRDFRQALQDRHISLPTEITPVVTGFPITPWAKDRCGTLQAADGRSAMAVPPVRATDAGARGNDERVPDLLASRLPGTDCHALPFFFDGGDLLSDERFAFVAANFLARNQPYDTDDRSGLLKRIGDAFNKTVIAIGNETTDVPDHHIGMYLTPLGNGAVAVGDPDLGLALTGDLPEASTLAIERDTSKYAPFRFVAEALEAKGLRVVRIPMLLTTRPQVYVTYNNAIQETRGSQKRIYMPTYGIPTLDQAATAVYEKEGWTVLPINVTKVYTYTGSLRCLIGILRREA